MESTHTGLESVNSLNEPPAEQQIEREAQRVTGHVIGTSQRLWACVLGVTLLGLLVTARCLHPSEYGMGTHQQLGLPPCTFLFFFGVRCPTCGMTTSWSHFTRGEFLASWQANPGGLCLAIVAMIVGCWSLLVAWRARYRPLLSAKATSVLMVTIGAITLLDWCVRIAKS